MLHSKKKLATDMFGLPQRQIRTTPFDSKSRSEPKTEPSTSRVIKLDIDDDEDFEKETESDYDNIPGYEMRREEVRVLRSCEKGYPHSGAQIYIFLSLVVSS